MFSCQGAIHGKGFYKQHQRPDCNAIQGLTSMRLEYTVLCTVVVQCMFQHSGLYPEGV